jgi:hypothetical protein
MIRLFVRHRVADYDAWRKVYDEFDATRRPMGVIGDAVFQAIDDPNDVTVWHDVQTADEARAFASSEAVRDVLQRAGIEGAPETWFVTPD